MVRVCEIVFDGGQHGVGRDEAGDVVNVAVGVVSGDSAIQPDDVRCAEPAFEQRFDLAPFETGISLLHDAEQALLGRQQRPGSVDVDRAALQNDAAFREVGQDEHRFRKSGNFHAGVVVSAPVPVLRPSVEMPLHGDFCVSGSDNPGRQEVARPTTVGLLLEQMDVWGSMRRLS